MRGLIDYLGLSNTVVMTSEMSILLTIFVHCAWPVNVVTESICWLSFCSALKTDFQGI